MAARDTLQLYRAKRDFDVTSEPEAGGESPHGELAFVIQKHWASHLHYDFRLELDGALKSWAVPKGPSLDPHDKRMAVQVEDHPIAYGSFEGKIPEGQYGAGRVIVWDRGTWSPLEDPRKGYKTGKLKFDLHGEKLHGRWTLVRMHGKDKEKQPPWLLIKENDAAARADGYDVTVALPESVGGAAARGRKAPTQKKAASRQTAPRTIPGRKAALPATLSPQLATLVKQPPAESPDWLYEAKFDGYRLLTRIDGRGVKLFTRNGHDWTHKLPELAQALGRLRCKSGWLDGEIVVPDENGAPDFGALQAAFEPGAKKARQAIVYFLFDTPFLDGRDLRQIPLVQRREILAALLDDAKLPDALRFSQTLDARPQDLVATACKLGLEGVVGKRADSHYVSRRSDNWIKLKCSLRQEFVIVGYTDPKGARTGLGSLLLAVHDADGALRYAGNVGTGFDERTLGELTRRLQAIETRRAPIPVPAGAGRVHWVRPQLLAEVSFGEWTRSGRIRHSVFHGLRSDKPARAITREKAAKGAPRKAGGMRITNADRVIDKASGLTKGDVAAYYAQVAPLLLPHLKKRPVALLRAPSGIDGPQFFQKHADVDELPGVRLLDPAFDPGHEPLMEIPSAKALVSVAQMNGIELHTWNATTDAIGQPDRMTFDLDPGEGVPWERVQEAATLVRVALEELGLESFLKTSGGKGLHVVVPLRRGPEWDAVKDVSKAIVEHLARTIPSRFVAKSGPKNRVGKIFVDYLRNGFGATTVSAWSVRARPGLGISVPVAWEELETLTGGAHWTLGNIADRLETGNEPWKAYASSRRSIGAALKKLNGLQTDARATRSLRATHEK
jgi:bifunctional non-homologous end joining protein LigD